ncbi:GvpL/GvpF family gas vesicle protein [Lentzea flava]|uniref:Gas vesicle protein GvpFL n=1 Tax=Lentzea flava TaxID=103732 RepID=A0ABQ2UB57_9PSEU|nr:GvpL/GvpF family gas vesicle protein [Lentzea flava]MCP2196589.1 Gas vesicle synthesis protein GvpL/GvpF [Lentzea flava]GGU16912.1 gas vesicle protein GvpFL [Lentzea flava]
MSLYLHGVVRASHRLPDDSPFRLVDVDDLAAVVSDRQNDQVLTEQEVVAHLEGLCALLPGGPVLPLRIGTTAVDEAATRTAVVALGPPSLRHHLDELDGMAEMHVRLVFDENTALRAVHDRGVVTSRAVDVVAQGELIAREIVAWRRKEADALLAPVAAVAKAMALLDAPAHTEEARAYLVPLDQVEAACAAVAKISEVTATCTGPLPAYHFLDPPRPASRWGW